MGRSYKTYEFTNKSGKDANDIHITWGMNGVEVIGVDGVSPAAPDADFTLEETGGISIISDHDVAKDGKLRVRVKSNSPKAPPQPKKKIVYFWTLDGARISKNAVLASLDEEEPKEEDDKAAIMMFDSQIDELCEKIDKLLRHNNIE